MKLTGHAPGEVYMQRARAAILYHGGADAVNSFTRFYLALLGQIPYSVCPCVPPEMMLLPQWFPVNLYRVSAWSRTMIVTLSIMSALKPVQKIDATLGIRELFLKPPAEWPANQCPGLESQGWLSWRKFFHAVDAGLKLCERWNFLPLRQKALEQAERWMLERFAGSDGLGAIFPPMVWSLIALKALGYEDTSLEMRFARERLDDLILEDEHTVRLQPCKSPVWDSAISMLALSDSGLEADHPQMEAGYRWLLAQQILKPGDWSETVNEEPGGWCFEYANDYYPDVDDTVMVMMALNRRLSPTNPATAALAPQLAIVSDEDEEAECPGDFQQAVSPEEARQTQLALQRAEAWVLAMQNSDGGWGAFDKDNDCEFLCHVPFADHNAMIDPSTPDLAARVLEALGQLGRRVGHPAVDRGLKYIKEHQESDGSWFGRWGVNYIYGTWQALQGMAAVGVPQDDEAMQAGAAWLLAYQQPCGGWGESPDSYADPSLKGQGTPTASQTAWALLGLISAGLADHAAVRQGIRFLLDTQLSDGSWHEPEFTGTGFPQVFYLKYHYYPIYFPLMALSRWAVLAQQLGVEGPEYLRQPVVTAKVPVPQIAMFMAR